MREQAFISYMRSKHTANGQPYTDAAIASRVSSLKKLERIFNIDIDCKTIDAKTAVQFLIEIRDKHIESLSHTPLSNAFRHYFEFTTGVSIGRIF